MIDIEYIQKINSLGKEKLKKLLSSLTFEQRVNVLRILMPIKMTSLFLPKRYKGYHGGRGGSKSHSACKAALKIGNEEKKKFLCTREFQVSIKESIHSELSEIINVYQYGDYKVYDNGIYNKNTRAEFIFKGLNQEDVKQSVKSTSGVDVCIVEEAQTISAGSLKILRPTIRKKDSEFWFLYNRMFPDDPVHTLLENLPDHLKISTNINYDDNTFLPNVLRADQEADREAYENGNNPDYPHVWKGEPVAYGDRTIIDYETLKKAIDQECSTEGPFTIGVDVARFGKDKTVFFKRKGLKVIDYKIYQKQSLTQTARDLIDFVNNDTSVIIVIDDTGLGGGVTDYMDDLGFNVVPVNFAQSANDKTKYKGIVTELWFNLRDVLKYASIPDMQELKTQLLTRQYKYDNQNRRQIESKDEYKKRGFKSPDLADALILCFADMEAGLTSGVIGSIM